MGSITRRDFLNGVGLAVGAAAGSAQAATPAADAVRDPAARTGLQGQTDHLAAAAHARRDGDRAFEGPAETDPGVEDLVVVGAGLSGLAGAWLFQRHAGRPVRILLLDALDDVGGHARRNEFTSRSGRRLVGYGGSQSLDTPGLFSPAVHALLRDVGIDLKRFETEFFDQGWARRHGLVHRARWFGREAWGEERLVLQRQGEAAADWLARTPLPPAAQADAARLLAGRESPAPPETGRAQRRAWLAQITYRDFLLRHWRLHPAAAALQQDATLGYFGVGTDATSALDAWAAGLPGFGHLDLGDGVDALMSPSGRQLKAGQDEYVHHFPDGNAGVARALLRGLMPAAVPGRTMESLADSRIDPAVLDRPGEPVRVRLRATVLGLRHEGSPDQASQVRLRYVDGQGTLREVRARQVLLACWHRVIARIAPELGDAQRQALDDQVKVPLLYANVLLSNWHAWHRAGIRSVQAPGGFWQQASLDFPVSMGGLRFAATPEDPMLVHLSKVVVSGDGRDARSQAAAGRRQLQGWTFDDLERPLRALLQGALGPYGFDAGRDIEAITINRWSHGYAYEYMRPWDAYWPGGPLPCETAHRGWGRVAIANADAGAYAYAHSAIDQAHRAVAELLPQARLPKWSRFPGPDPAAIGLG